MAAAPATREMDEVVCEIFIAAPPERVFEALSTPEQILEWWRNDAVFLERAEIEPTVAGRWGYETKQLVDGKRKFEVHGEVLACEPPRLLSYTWIANLHDDPSRRTVVRWELTPARGGTQVKLTHSGLANEQKSRDDYRRGWPGLLERLGKFVSTGTTTTRATSNADQLISEIEISAPPERVFQAIVEPAQVVKWWGRAGMYRCTEFHSDLRVGGKWRCAGEGVEAGKFEVQGEYLQIEPPRLLVHSWIASWTGDAKTTVHWELEPKGQGTLLRLRHTGLAAYPDLGKSYSGWPRLLGWLRALLEHGETVDDRKSLTS